MEELRSTEVLDREILEDARKKAFKILKTADDSVQSQAKRWDKKTARAIAEIKQTYESRTIKTRDEISARGPLDKRRLRSQTADFILNRAMENFLEGLKHEDMIRVLERELEERLGQCMQGEISSDEEPELYFQNIDKNDAEKILGKILAKMEQGTFPEIRKWQIEPAKENTSSFPLITVNTLNLKITASVENAAAKMLKEKRAELVSSLLGGGVLND